MFFYRYNFLREYYGEKVKAIYPTACFEKSDPKHFENIMKDRLAGIVLALKGFRALGWKPADYCEADNEVYEFFLPAFVFKGDMVDPFGTYLCSDSVAVYHAHQSDPEQSFLACDSSLAELPGIREQNGVEYEIVQRDNEPTLVKIKPLKFNLTNKEIKRRLSEVDQIFSEALASALKAKIDGTPF